MGLDLKTLAVSKNVSKKMISDNNNSISKSELDDYYKQSTGYTDKQLNQLINGAPETLNTLKEIADAIQENDVIVDSLNSAIGNKANQLEVDTHIENDIIHITSSERETWNSKQDAATAITGIKGDAESSYRTGNVNLTPANIGALPVNGTAKNAEALGNTPLRPSGLPYTWPYIPKVGTDGVMEIGKYIDFHASSDDTSNFAVRMTADATGLTVSGLLRGTFVGSLDGAATKANSVSLTNGTSDAYRNVWFSNSDDTSKAVYNTNFQYNPFTGILKTPKVKITTTGGSWIDGKTTAAIDVSNIATDDGFYPVLRMSTKSGHVTALGTISDKLYLAGYKSNRTANGTDWGFTWDVSTGDVVHDKSITAKGGFVGSLDGIATKATQDGDGNNIVSTYATKEEFKNRDSSYDSFVLYTSTTGGSNYISGTYQGTIDYTKYSVIMLCFTNPYRANVYCSTTVPTATINTGSMYSTTLWCHSNAVPSKSGSASDAFSSTITMSAKFKPYSKEWSIFIQSSCVGYVVLELICIKK